METETSQKPGVSAGPWQYEVRGNPIYEFGIFDASETDVAVVFESIGNARLIAAAPDLLEACQVVAGYLRRAEGKPTVQSCAAMLASMNAAIAKAEGR